MTIINDLEADMATKEMSEKEIVRLTIIANKMHTRRQA